MSNFYFTDRKYNLIDVVSTDGNTDIVVTAIKDIQSIEESARDFEATLFFNDDDFKLVKQLSRVGNFVLYKDREGQSVFITIESREINATDGFVMITGKDASIDLINEIVAPYSPDKSYSIAEYILRFTNDSGFEIGENAIPDKKLKLEEWTSEATALERILSVATRFDVELSFSFEISGLDVIKRYINISEKRGKDENVTLYANREIESITIKEDSFDLFTAIKPIGAIPEGKETPINLNNYKYTDPNGRYVLSGGILRDNMVVQEWSRLLSNENPNPTSAHTTRYKEYDTDNQAKLFTMAMTDLKKYAQLNVNYDVEFYEFPTNVSIGDTINLVDEDKEIYLSARVLTLTYDYVTETAEAVVGDYLIKESGISQDLENLASSMKDKFANVNENLNGKAVIVKSETAPEPNENIIWIDTSHPQTPIKTYDPETGEWLVSTGEKGKDGIAGKDGLGVLSTVITYAISASGITTPTGGWTAQVPTLEKGKYLWTKTQWTYTDGSTENGYTVSYIAKDGNDGNDGIAGKDGVGIKSTTIQYASSTSGVTAPTTGWQTNVPTVSAGNYLWTKNTWTYTDNTTEIGYAVSRIGKDGNTGKDGIAGKDGVGIKATSIQYAGSTSGTTPPTTGWTATVPTVASGSYLWTKTTWSYTDDTNETGYSVSRMGETGAKGDTGDSATSYWVTPSVNAIKISASKVLSPSTVTFTGYAKTGTANTVTYSGRFNVMTSTDGIVYSSVYTSSANQATYTYTIPATVKFIKIRMYLAGGTSVLLDEQTIPILESAEGLMLSQRNLILDSHKDITTTEYLINQYKLEEDWVEGEQYTFVVKGTPASGQTFGIWMNGASNRVGSLTEVYSTGIYYGTFTAVAPTSELNKRIVNLYNTPNNTTSATVDWVALYKGNKPFDWTPALGDTKLYTAWSNDPNGKDMVRVYPNENMVLKDKIGSHTPYNTKPIIENDGALLTTTYIGTAKIFTINVGFTPKNTYYTVSGRMKINGVPVTKEAMSSNRANTYNSTSTVKTATVDNQGNFVYTEQYTGTTTWVFHTYIATLTANDIVTIENFKFEESEYPTVYTPSPKDNPVKAEMAYIGYSPKDSNDPKDYVWSENPKAKGTFKRWSNDPNGLVDMTGIYPNENLLLGTSNEVQSASGTGWFDGTRATNATQTPPELEFSTNYTYSAYLTAPSDAEALIYVRLSRPGAPNGSYEDKGSNRIPAGKSGLAKVTFSIPTDTTTISFRVLRFATAQTSTKTIQWSREKLEVGSNVTTWASNQQEDKLLSVPQYVGIGSKDTMNPADFVWNVNPEYTQARTDLGLESKVDDETFNDAQDHMNEQIDSKASADELQALAELTENLKESYEGFISDGGKYEADLQALEARATGLLLDLEDKVLDLDFLKTRMRLGEEGFEIGAEESSMKMLLTNDRLSFMDSGKEIAYFSNQQFKINRGAILESIQIGSHKITKISDKMTVFQFVPPL